MVIVTFFVLHWYSSLFCQTFFQHRYSAHRDCTMSRAWERFFFVFCFLAQGSSYLSANAYGVMHRLHHLHADRDGDPHTPLRSSNPVRMMWDTSVSYGKIYFGRSRDEDLNCGPEWVAFEKVAHNIYARGVWIGIYGGLWIIFATAWWHWLLLPISIFMSAIHGTIINYYGHALGYRNFDVGNHSRNIIPFFDIILLGEGYHNNHHNQAGSSNFAVKWFEWDPTYLIMRILDYVGIIALKQRYG